MADRRTHYEVLGVDRAAPEADLRSAYLRKARTHHPDTAGADLSAISEAEREMRAINAAWEALGDSASRRAYDRTLPTLDVPGKNMGEAIEPDHDDVVRPDLGDDTGRPIGGVGRVLVRVAPVAFVSGFALLAVSAVLRAGILWRIGLVVLIMSLVAFLLAPFFVMFSAAHRDGDVS